MNPISSQVFLPVKQTAEQTTGHRGIGNPRKIKILRYGRIFAKEADAGMDAIGVPADMFYRQLKRLDRWGFTTITLDDYRLYLEAELNLPRKPVVLTFDKGYREIYEVAFPILQEFGMKAVVFVLADPARKAKQLDAPGLSVDQLLTEQQIIEMHSAGFEIGSISLSHRDLTSLPASEAWEEISRSRMLLEIMLNSSITSFAYPYGLLNDETKEMVAEAGYVTASGLESGPATIEEDHYEIRRMNLDRKVGMIGFALRLLTPYQRYEWGRWQVRQLLSRGKRSMNGAGM